VFGFVATLAPTLCIGLINTIQILYCPFIVSFAFIATSYFKYDDSKLETKIDLKYQIVSA